MRKRYRKNKTHDIRQGVTIAVLVLLVLWFSSLIWSLAGKAVVAWNVANETHGQANALGVRTKALEKRIYILSTQRGKEATIRTAFGVAREGEQVIVVMPTATHNSTEHSKPWWKKVLEYISL